MEQVNMRIIDLEGQAAENKTKEPLSAKKKKQRGKKSKKYRLSSSREELLRQGDASPTQKMLLAGKANHQGRSTEQVQTGKLPRTRGGALGNAFFDFGALVEAKSESAEIIQLLEYVIPTPPLLPKSPRYGVNSCYGVNS